MARIMAIDDSQTIRRTAETLLAKEGYEVITAADGFEALAKVADSHPDLILIDIMMPRLDGYQACALIKSNAHTRRCRCGAYRQPAVAGSDAASDQLRSAQRRQPSAPRSPPCASGGVATLSGCLPSRAYAFLGEGHPQLMPLNVAALRPAPLRSSDRPGYVLSRVRIATREALIPDLERIEVKLAATLASET